MKAFRLRGDTSTLKQAVTAHFDTPSLIDAYKHLWNFCGDLLKELGVTYHTRRSTDKRDAFEATLTYSLPLTSLMKLTNSLPFTVKLHISLAYHALNQIQSQRDWIPTIKLSLV